MITGAHAILHSSDADADRAFLQDLLGTTTVAAGGGWLILALPPAEVAVHPTDGPAHHELYLLCDDIETTHAALTARRGRRGRDWGRLITLRLPGGGALGVHEPRHPLAAGS